MDAIILLFITGLLGLFVGILGKPNWTLAVAVFGLVGAFVLQLFVGTYTSPFASYEGLSFNPMQKMFSLLAISFTLVSVLGGFTFFQKEKEHTGDYYGLLLFSLCGGLVLIGFTNLFMFFLGLEILSIPVYVLVGIHKGNQLSSEASIKYFFTGSFATAIMLFGIALVYGATGTFELSELKEMASFDIKNQAFFLIGSLFVAGAFLFKVGAVPFHFWSPDVYEGSPNSVLLYMASVVKICALYAFYRFFGEIFVSAFNLWSGIIIVAIILSLYLGYLSAWKQRKFRRLIAYSGIANTGFALFALLAPEIGDKGLWVFLTGYSSATVGLILVNSFLENENDDLKAWKGLGMKNPWMGTVILFALLSLSGIPPFTGFFGKYLSLINGINDYPWLVAVALVAAALGAFVYLRLLFSTFVKTEVAQNIELRPKQIISLILCLLGILGGWWLVYV